VAFAPGSSVEINADLDPRANSSCTDAQSCYDSALAQTGSVRRFDMILRAFAATLAALTLTAATPADTLKFNTTVSKIEFVGSKKDGSHNGGFKKFTGTIDMQNADFAQAKLTVEIQIESLYSDNEKLTTHLKSPDFFDVRTHPTAKFTSSTIRVVSGDTADTHLITGELTLHGVTKTVRIPVNAAKTATGMSLTGEFTIHRKDFGMTFGEGQVNDDVKVKLSIQAGK
jgi:polyisoprenoid-binding protein YceI